MAANKLVGDYQSDSDNDDSEPKQRTIKNITTDWTQCTDASSGHPYYWNIVTKDVTWEMPIEYRQFLDQAVLQNSHSLKKWILCYTDDNAPYYFNEITREISWERPADFAETIQNNSRHRSTGETSESSNRTISKAKLNLVPEYNDSDDSDDECLKPSEKPLFPSSSNSYPTNSQLIRSIEIPTDTSIQSEPQALNSPKREDKKEKPSFASIITGGRSPQHETIDIKLYTGQDGLETDETSNKIENDSGETEILSQKTFQRKRRIEFNVSSTQAKRPNLNEVTNPNTEPMNEVANPIASLKNKYSNFQKGGTEFLEKQPSSGSDDTEVEGIDAVGNQITDEQQLLEAKLNFLCQGRADVSPVQIIQIQLQALQAAHVAEALNSDYLLVWMKNISNDLINLENDAAPNGWKCQWNREMAQYCYENTTTGEIKWEYPEEVELKDNAAHDNTVIDDDAMDICTTPPPNEHEDFSAAYYQSTEHNADYVPPPPNRTTGEALKNDNEKPLDDELASFYSDIAKLEPEPETTNEENSCDKSSPNPDQPASPENSDADEKKKKKKKKTKKLEPWRSGNLENWINKWQKAQKELDG
ncbi:formin-binding protein 4-like isoform X2 [Sitodiplosis mosellana]|uniref:formin-binding protein 4-like isoform X2 n=1 Tax=Sitodiplosis mosellana TaxID=263140 RepID=UPI0024447F03|nr:formin-binding protein 4-like isoform X2 [Sitodiplosis mosellana]